MLIYLLEGCITDPTIEYDPPAIAHHEIAGVFSNLKSAKRAAQNATNGELIWRDDWADDDMSDQESTSKYYSPGLDMFAPTEVRPGFSRAEPFTVLSWSITAMEVDKIKLRFHATNEGAI